jgi:hypothetical protein
MNTPLSKEENKNTTCVLKIHGFKGWHRTHGKNLCFRETHVFWDFVDIPYNSGKFSSIPFFIRLLLNKVFLFTQSHNDKLTNRGQCVAFFTSKTNMFFQLIPITNRREHIWDYRHWIRYICYIFMVAEQEDGSCIKNGMDENLPELYGMSTKSQKTCVSRKQRFLPCVLCHPLKPWIFNTHVVFLFSSLERGVFMYIFL